MECQNGASFCCLFFLIWLALPGIPEYPTHASFGLLKRRMHYSYQFAITPKTDTYFKVKHSRNNNILEMFGVIEIFNGMLNIEYALC